MVCGKPIFLPFLLLFHMPIERTCYLMSCPLLKIPSLHFLFVLPSLRLLDFTQTNRHCAPSAPPPSLTSTSRPQIVEKALPRCLCLCGCSCWQLLLTGSGAVTAGSFCRSLFQVQRRRRGCGQCFLPWP